MNPGVEYATKTKIERNGIETTQVKSIKLLTDLDDGSANNSTNTILEKSGIVFDKTYEFKVETYTNDDPEDKSLIKWAVSYTDIETGQYYKNALEDTVTGDTISITFKNQNMCGSNLDVKAYINDLENEGKLSLFKHNRFRFFDREIIKNEVEERETKPYLANQNETSLCGLASIMYLLAKKDFEKYKKFILELYRTGISTCNNYNIDVKESLHLLEMNPTTNKKYPSYQGLMPYNDWISFSSIRDKENGVRDFDGENSELSFDGSTVPRELCKLMKEILNFTSVTDNTNVVFTKGALFWDGEDSSSREVAKMQELYLAGYSVCMLINTNMLKNVSAGIFSTIEHWVVFEGIIGGTITPDLYDFEVFTWGEIRKLRITPETFSSNFYGYVYGK